MNILFVGLTKMTSINDRGIYPDLLRYFRNQGHKLYIISPIENDNETEHLIVEKNITILRANLGNMRANGIFQKGFNTLLVSMRLKRIFEKYYGCLNFDLLLYTTPPITFVDFIEYVKRKNKCYTYLMLKDIFPQNALDLEILQKHSIKGYIYRYFRKKEKQLYHISDKIGCMSTANVDYIIKHNEHIIKSKIEVCPNSIEPTSHIRSNLTKLEIRKKYKLPQNKKIFVYGGNLGKPQSIPFIIKCLKKVNNDNAFFLIVGNGTEYSKLENFIATEKPQNVLLLKGLPRIEFEEMITACDIGLLFLDYRFTIPNFPSRLLSYMQACLPTLSCTDTSTDISKVITDNHLGWWCPSNDVNKFCETVNYAIEQLPRTDKKSIYNFLEVNYSVKTSYNIIMRSINHKE